MISRNCFLTVPAPHRSAPGSRLFAAREFPSAAVPDRHTENIFAQLFSPQTLLANCSVRSISTLMGSRSRQSPPANRSAVLLKELLFFNFCSSFACNALRLYLTFRVSLTSSAFFREKCLNFIPAIAHTSSSNDSVGQFSHHLLVRSQRLSYKYGPPRACCCFPGFPNPSSNTREPLFALAHQPTRYSPALLVNPSGTPPGTLRDGFHCPAMIACRTQTHTVLTGKMSPHPASRSFRQTVNADSFRCKAFFHDPKVNAFHQTDSHPLSVAHRIEIDLSK